MKKVILGILIGLSFSVLSVAAISLCNAKDIEYKASDTTWNVDTVEDALNDLYQNNSCSALPEECEYLKTHPYEYEYEGKVQTLIISCPGDYKIELWGAQGGNYIFGGNQYYESRTHKGGLGGYVSGVIHLYSTILHIYVGGQSSGLTGGYNGGSNGDQYVMIGYTYAFLGGGGATDVRIWENIENNYAINSKEGINSRIMVAGGGGAAGWEKDGGEGGLTTNLSTSLYQGSNSSQGSGAGGGFLAGNPGGKDQPGSGGSSYVSGCDGCKSVTSINDSTLTDNSNHYSGKVFTDIVMTPGVNKGNGKAKITYLG